MQVVNMATLLVKVFEDIKAVQELKNDSPLRKHPTDTSILHQLNSSKISSLSKSYSQEMPDLVNA